MPFPEPSDPSLADLIEAVQSANLTDLQKRDRISAIRTAAKALGAQPNELPLNVKLLRRRLEEVSPAALPRPMTVSRWANVRSLLNRSLELKTEVAPSAQRTPVSPAWKPLARALTRSNSLRLTALFRFLSARGVRPSKVTLSDLEAFRDTIIENRLRSAPEKTWDGIRWTWNKCAQDVEGWPQVTIPSEDRRTVYVRPWSDFPESLKADVDAYLHVLSGEVIDEDGPLRSLRPSTLKIRDYQARAAASVLAAQGAPAESLRSLSDVARLEPIKVILNEMHNRGKGGHRAGAFNMANFLKSAAQHWVKVDAAELAKIRRITSKLSPKQKGMTAKNRSRLMPFNDPEIVRSFLNLPVRLAEEVRRDGRKTAVNAVTAQMAVAIAILTAVPLRIANLAALDLCEHLIDRGGRLFVMIQADEVKNGRGYLMELPREVSDVIAWYCLEHRDQLIERPTNALFPGEDGSSKKPGTLSVQIGKRVEQHLGIPFNTHLFRHIAAKLYLDRKPGEYGLVSRVLNHRSVATTMSAYTGMESISAGRHYQSVVADIRGSNDALAKPKRRPALCADVSTPAGAYVAPVEDWPAGDQTLWAQACAPQSLFEDDGGELAALSSISRAKYAKGWGRWLTFLAEHDSRALQLAPADRCSKARVQAYVDHLRRSANSEGTIVNRLQELAVVTRGMAPDFDPRVVNRYVSAVRSKAKPVRSKSHVRPANELLDLGLRLMATATDPEDLDHAVAFRDGLIVSFLALHPVRRRNLADFKIGRNLVRQGGGFFVTFAGSETKTAAPFENTLADLLVEPMNEYLRVWRPILAKRTGRWKRDLGDAVWVSVDGSPMSQEGLSGRIELRTREAFGKAINPHLFRDAAATTLAIADPVRVRVTAPLLGHRSLQTTEKHYIQASGLEAQRSFLEVLDEARRDRR